MKASEARQLSIAELEKKVRETTEALLKVRVQKQVGQLEKPSEIKKIRRDIARLSTILREKVTA